MRSFRVAREEMSYDFMADGPSTPVFPKKGPPKYPHELALAKYKSLTHLRAFEPGHKSVELKEDNAS
jgi:hypothetical protein